MASSLFQRPDTRYCHIQPFLRRSKASHRVRWHWYPESSTPDQCPYRKSPRLLGCPPLRPLFPHPIGYTGSAAHTDVTSIPVRRLVSALSCIKRGCTILSPLPHGIIRSICIKNSFFFVRSRSSSSLRPDNLICLFINIILPYFCSQRYISVVRP